jgi:hypothetical protein
MEKLVKELKKGDKIELLDDTIGVVEKVILGDRNNALVCYDCGKKTFSLQDDIVEIIDDNNNIYRVIS